MTEVKRDPVRLKNLEEAANVALFHLHDYLRQLGDDNWKFIYGYRCQACSLANSILEQWQRDNPEEL